MYQLLVCPENHDRRKIFSSGPTRHTSAYVGGSGASPLSIMLEAHGECGRYAIVVGDFGFQNLCHRSQGTRPDIRALAQLHPCTFSLFLLHHQAFILYHLSFLTTFNDNYFAFSYHI